MKPQSWASHFSVKYLDDPHCHALATAKEKDQLCVELFSVKFTAASREAFAETLRLNYGLNLDLNGLIIIAGDLARALHGNRTVQSISGNIYKSMRHTQPSREEIRATIVALSKIRVYRNISWGNTCNEARVCRNWAFAFQAEVWTMKPESSCASQSIEGYPSLEELNLRQTGLGAREVIQLAPI